VSDNIRELGAQFRIDDVGNLGFDHGSESEIGERNTLMDEEGASSKVSVECGQGADEALHKSCVELNEIKKSIND
jgi:hypothetical protein